MSATIELKQQGNEMFAHCMFAHAIIYYQAAQEFDPSNAALYFNQSLAYGSLKDWARSWETASLAIALDEKYTKAHYRVGVSLFETRQFLAARRSFETAVQLDPNNTLFANALQQCNTQQSATLVEPSQEVMSRIFKDRSTDSEPEVERARRHLHMAASGKTAAGAAATTTSSDSELLRKISNLERAAKDQDRSFSQKEMELRQTISILEAAARKPLSREDVGKMEDAVLKSSLEYIMAEQVHRRLCVICLDSDAKILFLPCQHQKVCANCSEVLTKCPCCQQIVKQKIVPY